jgi:hypothetical protein
MSSLISLTAFFVFILVGIEKSTENGTRKLEKGI